MDAYQKGLNGRQAAWASKKYRGHQVLPDSIIEELDKANINNVHPHRMLTKKKKSIL